MSGFTAVLYIDFHVLVTSFITILIKSLKTVNYNSSIIWFRLLNNENSANAEVLDKNSGKPPIQ
jgi:hypothetical protein